MIKELFIGIIVLLTFGLILGLVFVDDFKDKLESNVITNSSKNIINNVINSTNTQINTITRVSISTLMHNTIDPVSPTFLNVAEDNCIVPGGTWVDTKDRVGCFNMPFGTFNPRECITNPAYQLIQNTCSGIEAIWVCNSENIGCYYN